MTRKGRLAALITAVNALTELLVLSSPMKNKLSSGCYGIMSRRIQSCPQEQSSGSSIIRSSAVVGRVARSVNDRLPVD